MAIPLGCALLRTSTRPTRTTVRKPTFRRSKLPERPSLFGLAPGGVYLAAAVTSRAVRSYRTISPLPAHPFTGGSAVCFLWHFPWGCPRRTLSGTLLPWSPDFPPVAETTSGHPAIWRRRTMSAGQGKVKHVPGRQRSAPRQRRCGPRFGGPGGRSPGPVDNAAETP